MTPELARFLTAIVPLFREAAFFIAPRGRSKYRSAFEAVSDVAHTMGLPGTSVVQAFNAWTGATSDVWNKWDAERVASELRGAADSFEAQLERAA